MCLSVHQQIKIILQSGSCKCVLPFACSNCHALTKLPFLSLFCVLPFARCREKCDNLHVFKLLKHICLHSMRAYVYQPHHDMKARSFIYAYVGMRTHSFIYALSLHEGTFFYICPMLSKITCRAASLPF